MLKKIRGENEITNIQEKVEPTSALTTKKKKKKAMSLTLYLCFVLWLATGYLKCIVTLKDEAYKNEPD